MSRQRSTDDALVVTRTGLFYHRPGCRQVKTAVQPYEPGMRRTDPQTGQSVEVRACKVCGGPQSTESPAERPAPWYMGTVQRWKIRNGTRVPAAECLAPPLRVSAKKFAAWMESMMDGEDAPAS
jgi:hypothetical protein